MHRIVISLFSLTLLSGCRYSLVTNQELGMIRLKAYYEGQDDTPSNLAACRKELVNCEYKKYK